MVGFVGGETAVEGLRTALGRGLVSGSGGLGGRDGGKRGLTAGPLRETMVQLYS